MTSIPQAYRKLPDDFYDQPEIGEYNPDPDMSQVTSEMPSMEEYRRWEEAFTAHLGFTSPEFNFKLMRFIGASKNMIDELKIMFQNESTKQRWDDFVKHQTNNKIMLVALSCAATEIHPVSKMSRKKSSNKTRNKRRTQKKKVKRGKK